MKTSFCGGKCRDACADGIMAGLTIPPRPVDAAAEAVLKECGGGFTVFHDMVHEVDAIVKFGVGHDHTKEILECMDPMYAPSQTSPGAPAD